MHFVTNQSVHRIENMLTHMQFNSIEQLNDSRYLRTSSSALPMQNSYHQLHLPVPDDLTCSAYFLTRVDLSDYTVDTLKQIVDRHVSGPKSKGKIIRRQSQC